LAHIITVYAKYVITVFLYLFLGVSLWALPKNNVKKQKNCAAAQSVFLFLIQLTAYVTIVIRTRMVQYLIFYMFLQILTLLLPEIFSYLYPGISKILLNQMSLLIAVGMILMTRLDMDKAISNLEKSSVSPAIDLSDF